MPKNLTQEQFWQIFQKLPEETQKLILAEQTAMSIFDICDENGVDVIKISEVGRYVGQVLMGVLPAAEFQNTLEKEVDLKKEAAVKVSQGIQDAIFSQVGKKTETAEPSSRPDIYREPLA